MPLVTPPIKNIKEVTEPLKEQILKGTVHTIDEMRAWLKPLGYSEAINDAAINFILCEFVMSKVPSGSLCNAEMIVDHLHPQLEHQTSDIIHHTSIDTNLFPVIHKWLASLEPSDYEAVQPYAFYGRQIGLFT